MFAGVDIGGLSVKVGLVTANGSVVARRQQKYESTRPDPQDVVDLAVALLRKVLETVSAAACFCCCVLKQTAIGSKTVYQTFLILHSASNVDRIVYRWKTWKPLVWAARAC